MSLFEYDAVRFWILACRRRFHDFGQKRRVAASLGGSIPARLKFTLKRQADLSKMPLRFLISECFSNLVQWKTAIDNWPDPRTF